MIDMRSEKCKTCIHTKVCMKDLNIVGEMFVTPNPIFGETEEAWERYKEWEAQGFPCEDYLEIVRCKDCKHYSVEGETTQFGWCNALEMPTDEMRYCSDGERREP